MILATSTQPADAIVPFFIFFSVAMLIFYITTREAIRENRSKINNLITIICVLLSAFGLFELLNSMCPSSNVYGLVCSTTILGALISNKDEKLKESKRFKYFLMIAPLSSIYMIAIIVGFLINN